MFSFAFYHGGEGCHLHIWGYWYFSRQSWFQLMLHPVQHFSWCTLHMLNKQGDNIQPWRTPFPIWNSFSMSSSNCCFLTCLQISQEAGKVVWYSHLLKNFPESVVIHTVKGFGVVNKTEADVFLELSCFFYNPKNVGNLISGSSAFSKSSLNTWKFMYYWSLAWSILSITLLACEMSVVVQ